MSTDPLALIERHIAALARLALSDEGDLPDAPDLSSLSLLEGDVERAEAVLRDLRAAGERLAGMQVRIRGEIEGMRRPRRESLRPAPRTLDTSA